MVEKLADDPGVHLTHLLFPPPTLTMHLIARVAVVAATLALPFALAQPPQTIGIQDGEQCPFILKGTPIEQTEEVVAIEEYDALVADLVIEDVLNDIIELLTTSDDCWPADNFPDSAIGSSYGALFIRLAWHCSGSWRSNDTLGGCAGGEMRFQPEAAWDDNTNLDKARALIYPIKEKYGDALSWGDLIILAGSASILHMGGPVTEICVGRVDNGDGTRSFPLGGPGTNITQCEDPGNCDAPFGTSTVGLIYVNPEGFLGDPDRLISAQKIREVFTRMDMNDTETVALIGGGHTFGKSHGACDAGNSPGPDESPDNPWPGLCGTGRGADTYTSGIDGYWTRDPFRWTNDFFTLLVDFGDNYVVGEGPGGLLQWSEPSMPDPMMMMTTDLALWEDADYRVIVTEFAEDIDALNVAFANAWEKLTTRGGVMSDSGHCITPVFPRDPAYIADALQDITDEPVVPVPDTEEPQPGSGAASGVVVGHATVLAVTGALMALMH